MATPADAVVAAARSHKDEPKGDNDCARFVSDVFAATGHGSLFGYHASVPDIVARFSGAVTSTDLGSAQLADLVVFGPNANGEINAHIMIYTGNGGVTGTGGKTDASGAMIKGSTRVVVDYPMGSMSPRPNKVLHTNLTGALSAGIALPFGKWFKEHYPTEVTGGSTLTTALLQQWTAYARTYPALQGNSTLQLDAAMVNASTYVGRKLSDLPDTLSVASVDLNAGIPNPLDLFGTLFAWVPGFAITAGILVLAAVLVYAGVREVASSVD